MFQHTAARRRLVYKHQAPLTPASVSTHSRPKAAGSDCFGSVFPPVVSTHSRPKAAGIKNLHFLFFALCFNTQPPEGGWSHGGGNSSGGGGFNTQPPEGGWGNSFALAPVHNCFNTQPPEGGW